MRRLRGALVVLGVVAAGALVWAADHTSATCPTRVDFRGVSYTPVETSEEITSADDVGLGKEHGCGWRGPYIRSIGMNSIPGVDPRLALASPVSAHTVYLAGGVTPLDLPEEIGTVITQPPS